MVKKKKQKSTFQEERLSRFFIDPPYGTRFWILAPFVHDADTDLVTDIRHYLGIVPDIRPMITTAIPGGDEI